MEKVEWKYANWINITKDEMKDKINLIKENYLNLKAKSNSNYSDWRNNNTWFLEKRNNSYIRLYIKKDNDFFVYYTNFRDDNKNTNEYTGKEAIQLLEYKFKEINNIGLLKAFGSVDESFKLNIPRQFYFVKETSKNKIIDGISILDFSSHYPSCGSNLLPDAHKIKKIGLIVPPTEEYPFAFYSTGHIAIYNELDTNNWVDINNPFMIYMLQKEVLTNKITDETYTILMKASKYTLKDTYQYFYDKRKEDEINKLVLNASIGYFHTKSYTTRKFAHLAAVIIARANNKMYNLAKKVGFKNILHICVDGLIYKGNKSFGYGEGLGSLKQEFLNKSIYIKGCNQYIVSEYKQYNNCLEVKHGGFDARIDNKDLEKADYITDINNYYKKSDDALFELLEE